MRYLITDLETIRHDCAADFVPPPDLSQIQAARNLKDPVKIELDIAQRKADALAEHANRLSRAALDWNLNRIVALAWHDTYYGPACYLCQDEVEEAAALSTYWTAMRNNRILGFCARTFDVPVLIQRSRLLGVKYPYVNRKPWGNGDVEDLFDILTFDNQRAESIMPRSLKAFAKRFGIQVDDPINGEDIPRLVAEGNWEAVRAHVTSDVRLTMALADKLGFKLSEEPRPVLDDKAQQEVGL